MFLIKLSEVLKKNKVEWALAGGYAVALHGAVRGTIDVDIVVSLTEQNLELVEKSLLSMGLVCKIPVSSKDLFHFRQEYIKNKNLIAWSFVNPTNPTELVDILVIHDANDFEIDEKKISHHKIPILSVNSLIKMKRKSGRPQDIEDVKALEKIK